MSAMIAASESLGRNFAESSGNNKEDRQAVLPLQHTKLTDQVYVEVTLPQTILHGKERGLFFRARHPSPPVGLQNG